MARILAVLLLSSVSCFAANVASCGPRGESVKIQLSPSEGVPSADPARATVIVLRTSRVAWIQSLVGMDGKWIGANKGSTYLVTQVDPGEHTFCSRTRAMSDSHITILTEPGQTYFLEQALDTGTSTPPQLRKLDKDEATDLIARFKLSHPKN